MSGTVQEVIGFDALRAQVDSLAHRQAELHARLLEARTESVRRASEIESTFGELRTALAQQATGPLSYRTEGQRVANKYLAYQQLIGRIREVAYNVLPQNGIVLVASRGDEDLVKLDACTAWHFPRNAEGKYAGYYPKDSADAIEHLESLRAAGAAYLLFPQTAFWWLDHYAAFKQHLKENYQLLANRDDACVIYDLGAPYTDSEPTPPRTLPVRRKTGAGKNGNGKHKR